jgi:hypothetical protein
MKTVKEWLMELPEGYRERALAQCINHDYEYDRLEKAITFNNWASTIEGEEFWLDVWEHYFQGSPLPQLPPPPEAWELLAINCKLKARNEELEEMFWNAVIALEEKQ